ncbi:unnamed protein product [Prorocentrum cordatum]|uniref:Uncharacterized protein n=1 Tax=Prorocentrum cordatum TaxID=2364126 RepID=A0ABN9YE46_9DINO|nr:unnamed protein product [Polarella glacialis]
MDRPSPRIQIYCPPHVNAPTVFAPIVGPESNLQAPFFPEIRRRDFCCSTGPKLARNLRLACLTTLPLWASPNAEAAQAAGTFVYSSQRGAGRGRERAPAARGLAGCVLVRPVLPNTRG